MSNFTHFSLEERTTIQSELNARKSFKTIALQLGKAPSSIGREVKRHIAQTKSGSYGRKFNDCANRSSCSSENLCKGEFLCSRKLCRNCRKTECKNICPDYCKETCSHLNKPPYVCNGCEERTKCTLEKSLYSAAPANDEAKLLLSESRSGVSLDEEEIARLDGIIAPLVKKGQSIHHICANNSDSIMCSERTIYNYVGQVLSVRSIDLPRKVRYRPRKLRSVRFKVDKACRVGRTYNDYLAFTKETNVPVVQIDSVEGRKGGKVLLTFSFVNSLFMMAYLRDANTSKSVTDIFEGLWKTLGEECFKALFPVILTDNGSKFSNPQAIEFDEFGNRRTRLFYCNPSSPHEKGTLENSHEAIRRILPKGTSFDGLTQNDVQLMMNHINSYSRKKLNDKTPCQMFDFLHGEDVLRKLGSQFINAHDIVMKPALLKRK